MTHPFKPRVSMTSREAVSLAVSAHCRVLEAVTNGDLLPMDDATRAEVKCDLADLSAALQWLCKTVGTRENSRDIREVAG